MRTDINARMGEKRKKFQSHNHLYRILDGIQKHLVFSIYKPCVFNSKYEEMTIYNCVIALRVIKFDYKYKKLLNLIQMFLLIVYRIITRIYIMLNNVVWIMRWIETKVHISILIEIKCISLKTMRSSH